MRTLYRFFRTAVWAILILTLAACNLPAASGVPAQGLAEATRRLSPTPSTTPFLPATGTPTPQPSSTGTATPPSTPTATPHPMQIEAMRAGSYPGSPITIEAELE
ncbi:MAG TPA: hypothetical protein VFF68_14160, partial [Anaerolineaceae bacterium]|nr:hypothetical protein [Anaerolineaceae bacterium]